jgi:hypothetical protein
VPQSPVVSFRTTSEWRCEHAEIRALVEADEPTAQLDKVCARPGVDGAQAVAPAGQLEHVDQAPHRVPRQPVNFMPNVSAMAPRWPIVAVLMLSKYAALPPLTRRQVAAAHRNLVDQ